MPAPLYRVSVIIPIYNVEAYILQCLQSVANQTMTEGVECILVDDCGNDRSMVIAEDFVSEYNGSIAFKIVCHHQNRGLSAARNTGILEAKGKYIYLLDSDDELTENCISAFFNIIDQYVGVEMVQGSYTDVRDLKKFWNIPFPEYTEDKKLIKASMLDYDIIPVNAQNRLVLREFIINNNLFFPEGIIHEDNYWTFFLAKHVDKMAYCRVPTYKYTINPDSITGNLNMEKECKSFMFLIESFSQNIDDEEIAAQKSALFYLFLNMKGGHFFKSKSDYKTMMSLVSRQCNCLEKPLFYLCASFRQDVFCYHKFVRLLIHFFKWFN